MSKLNRDSWLARADVFREILVDEDVDGREETGVSEAVDEVDADHEPEQVGCTQRVNSEPDRLSETPRIIVVRQPRFLSR